MNSSSKPTAVKGGRRTLPSSTAAAAASRVPLCRYHFGPRSSCRKGSACPFSHELPDGATQEEAVHAVPCAYYARGNCRYGASCRFSHGGDRGSPDAVSSSRLQPQQRPPCGICLEDVVGGKKYGLLSACDHAFCLECVRNWRRTDHRENRLALCCPECRTRSDYVTPSEVFVTGSEKERVAARYKNHLSTVPCRMFNGDLGSCPFGPDCFYAHRDAEGRDVKQNCRRPERSRRRRFRRGRQEEGTMSDLEMLNAMLMMLDFHGFEFRLGSSGDEEDGDDSSSWSSVEFDENFFASID